MNLDQRKSRLADVLRRVGYSVEWHNGRFYSDAPQGVVDGFCEDVLLDELLCSRVVEYERFKRGGRSDGPTDPRD